MRAACIPATTGSGCEREAVYLLHGFAARPVIMRRLGGFLRGHGYAVHNWGYRTLRGRIAGHAEALRDELQTVAESHGYDRVHLVAHSLGSIVARQALCGDAPGLVERVVMLAPPNRGSHVARAGALVMGRVCPVLHELSSRSDSFVNRLGEPRHVEVGVIAASQDWVVRRCHTHLESQRDHVVVRGDHVRLPLLRACAEQTLSFLRTGAFHSGAVRRLPDRPRLFDHLRSTRRAKLAGTYSSSTVCEWIGNSHDVAGKHNL